MDFSTIDLQLVTTLLLLLLIGMGPKIALVPFIEKTKSLDPETRVKVARRMVVVAVVSALVVFLAGALLLELLHITPGAVAVAGGIILALLAIKMALGPGEDLVDEVDLPIDHHRMAVYPLAVPFLFNPVGVTVLIVASEAADKPAATALMVGLIVLVGAFDWLVFTNIDKIAKRMRPTTMIVSEIVFGILLTAVAVQLFVFGLGSLGIIDPAAGGQH